MKSLKYINKYFYKYKWRLILGVIFIVLSNIFAIYGIEYAGEAVNFLKKNFSLDKDFLTHQLFIYAAKILSAALLSGVFLFFTRQTIIVMSRLIEYDMKNEIYEHYQQLDISFYKRNNTGDLMNRISEDVGKVRMYIGPAVMYIINTIMRFALTIVAMYQVNITLATYVLLPMPVLAISIYYISELINRKSTSIQQQLSTITTHAQEAFSGIRVLKSYGRENFSLNEFAEKSEEYRKRNIGLVITEALFHPSMILLVGISNIIIIYIGGKMVIEGTLQHGDIIKFILYVNALTWPIASLGWVTSLIQRAAASQTRINEFLHTSSAVKVPQTASKTEDIEEIEFKNVSFTYGDTGIQALNNVSFKIKKGESLAVIGRTGSGKSTIAQLIPRLYDTTGGDILINRKNINQLDLADLRSKIGYIPQDVFLFSDSIKNNIAFSIDDERINNDEVEEAAKKAAIHSNIDGFPQKYETVIGERGITLSGGQKQRIAIARAIIKNAQLFIFDDCLSAVDTETEEEILSNLKGEAKNKTSIFISHRVSTVKNADNIIVLDNGTVVEKGTHRDLLEKKGFYFELYQKQLIIENRDEKK